MNKLWKTLIITLGFLAVAFLGIFSYINYHEAEDIHIKNEELSIFEDKILNEFE